VDGLAKGYAGKPVLFLEYKTDSPHAINRLIRFMAAWQLDKTPSELKPSTPYTMIDSGQQISYGERDFQTEYRGMIEDELPRPPLAIVNASRERPNTSSLLVKAQVTNISTTTLQTGINGAAVHVMIYEGNRALHAGTEIKASAIAFFNDPLAPGDTATFEFPFLNLRGVNLSAAEAAVLVDYQAPGQSGRFDMLQAAIAVPGALPPTPTPWPTPTTPPTVTPVPPPTEVPTVEPTQETIAAPQHFELYLPRLLRRVIY
jgi:hypothetical protein